MNDRTVLSTLEAIWDAKTARRGPSSPTIRGSVGVVHVVDDSGRTLDAEYLVEPDGGHFALIMESRSGMSGALFKTLLSGAMPCIAGHLRKSRDTPQKVIKEQRLSWKN